MANTAAECVQMIDACRHAQRKLMIAYRIQYEPNNRKIKQMARNRQYGQIKLIEAANTQRQGTPDQWRLKRALAGGGALPDIGIYCLNTVRFITGEEPEEVRAVMYSTPNDPRFAEVEESVMFQLRFPSGILASNVCSYDAFNDKRYRVHATEGWFGMDPGFSYRGLRMEAAHSIGPAESREHPALPEKNQFALEIDHMAQCIREGREPYTGGEEGLQDHRIMAAIYEAAQSGNAVKLPASRKLDAFRGPEPSES
jgi:predicted dehydrogenase